MSGAGLSLERGPGLTIGSLFSGIGGLELGLERAGLGPVLWQVECDAYARQVLWKHWPRVPKHRDVRHVGVGAVERVDLICGGFPCQDISDAGRRAGIDGKRSGLWREFARVVRDLGPLFVVVENVARLLRRGMGRVLGDLAACGFDAEWDCLPAASVGAPHLRDRVFIVAARRDLSDAERERLRLVGERGREQHAEPRAAEPGEHGAREPLADSEGERSPERGRGADEHGAPQPERRGGDVADADSEGRERERRARGDGGALGHVFDGRGPDRGAWWAAEPDVGRVAHGVPARVDRLRCLGNAVVPQVAEHIGRRLIAALAGGGS